MRVLVIVLLLTGCDLLPQHTPLPPPSVEDARVVVEEVINAGIDRDWERLCAIANRTCEGELEGVKHLAPEEPPRFGDFTVAQPTGQSTGGVLFVLCGVDAAGTPYESEVLVFDSGRGLLATAAVYWTGTRILFAADGEATTGGAETDPPSC